MTQNQKFRQAHCKSGAGRWVSCKGFFEVSYTTLKTEQPAHRDTRPECAFACLFWKYVPESEPGTGTDMG
ncbi:MAG: hypothetical protein ACLUU0_03370 [Anaerostipes hadrus]